MKALNVLSLILAMSFGFAASLQAQCSVNFTWNSNSSQVIFVSSTQGMNPSSTTYTWDYGDNQIGTGGPTNVHTYMNSGMYYACVTATDTVGCSATYCDTIWVNNGGGFLCGNAYAAYTYTTTPNGTHFVSAYGGFSGSPATPWYFWNFGNGTTSNLANPSGIQLSNGWHNVCLTISDSSCTETYCDSVFIGNSNCAGFYAAAALSNVNGNTATFVSTASGGTPAYSYFWQFGDGGTSTQANPSHTYTASGAYNVVLIVTDANGCNYTAVTNVVINAPCSQNPLRLTLVFDNYASETSWDLRNALGNIVASGSNYNSSQNGTTLTQNFCLPTGCYTFNIYDAFGDGICCNYGQGSYTLTNLSNNTVLATGGQFTSAASNNICVGGASNPCANFAAGFQNVVNGNTVIFNSFVTGGTPAYTYSWNFGDGGTSNLAHPTHTYTGTGSYGVFLIVTDANGCNYTAYDTVIVTAPCTGNNATLTLHFDNYAPETSWDIRNANNGVVASGSGYSYNQNGTTLNIPLCLLTGCYTLNVYDSYGDGMCCLYGNGSYSLTSGGAVLASGGSFNYSETSTICVGGATNPCANSFALFSANNNNGTVQFVATSNLQNPQYVWNFGNGTTGTGSTVTQTYPYTSNTGYYIVCVTAYGANGCHATYCDTITITPQPCASNLVTLSLNFDNFAYETTWNITDANNNILYNGGGYTMNQNGTTWSQNFCLPAGCYNFNINDSYGDGICCAWGNGSYSLTNANGVVLASGGAFTYSESTNICVGGATNPCANFNAVATYNATPNGVVQFVATATGGSAPYTYSWSFGSTVANPVMTYSTTGYYTACVVITDATGCSSTTCLNVWVNTGGTPGGSPCSNLTLDMNITQDPNNPFNLIMQPVVNGAPANAAFDFVWDFGDGTGTMMGYPSHQYNNFGSYIVCIMAIDSFYGCAATYCDTITIDSSGNFTRSLDYKDVKPGFTVGTQTAIVNYVTSVNAIATEGLDMELFPNPANEYINLGINSTENMNGTITILDVTGKTLYESNVNVNAGYQQITLPTSNFASGVYLVKVVSDNAQQTMKFVKE